MLDERVSSLREQFKVELRAVQNSRDVEQLKVRYLGKKGPVQDLMSALRSCTEEERPHLGKKINDLKQELSLLCDEALGGFLKAELSLQLFPRKNRRHPARTRPTSGPQAPPHTNPR